MLTFLLMLCFQEANKPVYIDRIAIKVNDKIITERELVHTYKQNRAAVMNEYSGAELDQKLKEVWNETIAYLEERLLLYENAVELGMAMSEDESRSRLMSIKESRGFSDEEFEQVLAEQTGMTLDEYIAFRQRDDSATMIIQSKILSKIRIEDSEIAQYYDNNQNEFLNPATYRIAEIVFLKSDSSANSRVQDCLTFLKDGGSFDEAAKKFSDSTSRENGGDLGLVEYGDFNEAIENRVKASGVGDVSEPFETPGAFFIIKLLERNEASPKRIEDVREDIVKKLQMPRVEKEIDAYLADLKGRYLLQTILKDPPWYMSL